jgi:phytoene desaturase (3,4-didehydrolycopene-forming)
MKQCIPAYQIVFEDGERISVGFPRQVGESMTPEEQESRRIMDSWEPNGAVKWDEYMAITSAFLDCGLPNFIEEKLDLASFPNFLVQSFRDSAKAWPLKPHSDVLDAVFESNKLKALASFQDLYVGLEPYNNPKLLAGGVLQSTAPAVFGLLAAIELHPSNDKAGGKI